MKKVIIGVIIFAMILTGTAFASSYNKWSKEIQSCEKQESSGYLVIESSEGVYIIEFDDDAEYFGITEFDADMNIVDEQYIDYDAAEENDGVEIYGIQFFHN